MRVVSGFAGGHKLMCAEGDGIRPTSDRVKEAVFSSLGYRLEGCRFLDLFSGTGACGIEAMSRGAQFVCFVEPDPKHADILKHNIAHIIKAIPDPQYEIIHKTAFEAVDVLKKQGNRFDIVFMDPPYNKDLYCETLNKIHSGKILREDGIVVVESSSLHEPPKPDFLNMIKTKRYGKTSVYYMEPIRRTN